MPGAVTPVEAISCHGSPHTLPAPQRPDTTPEQSAECPAVLTKPWLCLVNYSSSESDFSELAASQPLLCNDCVASARSFVVLLFP